MVPNESKGNVEHTRAALRIYTLGGFRVLRDGLPVDPKAWGRDKALHLFQFLVTNRERYTHKEQIIDQLWPQASLEAGDRDFRVALNAVYRALEPDRAPRAEARFINRVDLAYGLDSSQVWVDADAFEAYLSTANRILPVDIATAIENYRAAIALYHGEYLPDRRYEDWVASERERLGILALSGMTTLAELEVEHEPREALRLSQRVLAQEPLWEEAYRAQMRAYQALGNRPMAMRTYMACLAVLNDALSIEPLPETQRLYLEIKGNGRR
ncbi:MAG TPA: bacterial transcriptional activator domain-containing protein [Anaerolineales bacterium]|nr:bacterial transcriptional activator domain-containing protein [Anaerolineales bacterium]